MHIICLTPLEEGVYNDFYSNTITMPPEGWAYIPDDFPLPSTFPRLGSLEAEEKTYTVEVEVEKEVTKTRPVEMLDEEGKTVIVNEEYTAIEMAIEDQKYTMMTVTAMTEGTLPEPVEEPETKLTTEERLQSLEDNKADQTSVDELSEALEMLLSGVTE